MKSLINFFILLLVFVSSTQILGSFIGFYSYLDELLLIILAILAILNYLNNKKIDINIFLFLTTILLLCSIGISLLLNYYSIEAFILKFTYYVKIILSFLILPYFSKYISKKTIKIIITFIVILALLSIIEFILIQYHIIDLNTYTISYKFRNGIYRAMSLTGHPLSLGMASLITLVYLLEYSKKYYLYMAILFVSILATGSRLPLLILFIYFLYRFWNTTIIKIPIKYYILISIPSIALILIYILTILNSQENTAIRYIGAIYSLDILSNIKYFIFGTGIGSYGTFISAVHDSYVYSMVNFPEHYLNLIRESSSGIESFFIMSLTELGIIGFFLYYAIIFYKLLHSTGRIKYFLTVLIVLYSFLYPMYTLPFIFLLNVFFFNSKIESNSI